MLVLEVCVCTNICLLFLLIHPCVHVSPQICSGLVFSCDRMIVHKHQMVSRKFILVALIDLEVVTNDSSLNLTIL